MKVLWNHSNSMTAAEIADSIPDITTNIVQAFLRGLLKKDLIVIDKIVYSNTVLCRSFKPAVTQEDYTLAKFSHDYEIIGRDTPKTSIVSALLDINLNKKEQQENTIISLEKILTNYKKKTKNNQE